MRRILLLTLAVGCVGLVFASAKKVNPDLRQVESIKNSSEHIWGIGQGSTSEEAYNSALHDLVRKISQQVRIITIDSIKEELGPDGRRLTSEMFSSVVESYSAPASLVGVQKIDLCDGPDYERFLYISLRQIDKMQQDRRYKVANFAREGIKARDNGQVDDALRYLYRSYVLLQSLPSSSEVKEYVEGEERVLQSWIPQAMRDIISKVTFGVPSVENDPDTGIKWVNLTVKYNGEKVTSCTFRYDTGTVLSEPFVARDGIAQIPLGPEVPLNPLKLYVEYLFKNENHVDEQLKPLLDTFNGNGLVNNEFTIVEKKLKANKKEAQEFQRLVAAGAFEEVTHVAADECAPYAAAMEKIISSISQKKFDDVKDLCTADGWKLFDKLMSYGSVKILGKPTPDTYAFYPYRDEVMCRSVPMSFTFGKGSGKRTFTEDITFTFNKDGKLVSVGLGLGSIARRAIFAKEGAAWTDEKKMELVNFLENYRTAFALQQRDYIESIFDDNAVIIVGHVNNRLERVPGVDGFKLASKEDIVYTEFTKKSYMERLNRVFDSQEYINLRFTDTDVERSGVGGDTYAIQLRQDYVSTTYGDQGYLFLFVDFNDPDKPLIHVRTWQPERNPDLTPNLPPHHPRAGIFSPASF